MIFMTYGRLIGDTAAHGDVKWPPGRMGTFGRKAVVCLTVAFRRPLALKCRPVRLTTGGASEDREV
jgi:hypothetical protein